MVLKPGDGKRLASGLENLNTDTIPDAPATCQHTAEEILRDIPNTRACPDAVLTETNTLEHNANTLRRDKSLSHLEPKPSRARANHNQPNLDKAEAGQNESQARPQELHRPQATNLGGPGSSQADINRTAHSRLTVTVIEKSGDGELPDQRRELRDIVEKTSNTQHTKGKDNVVASTLSRSSTPRPEQWEEEHLLTSQSTRDATGRNKTDSGNTEKELRVEGLLPPCDTQVGAVRMVPDANSATGMLGKTLEPENVRNTREWARERQPGGNPDSVNARQPKPDRKLTADMTVSGRQAVVSPRTGQRMLKESTDSHIATREVQQKKRPSKSDSRRHRKKSQNENTVLPCIF